MKRDFLSLTDITSTELLEILELADTLKTDTTIRPLERKGVAMIFQKPSLRTRISFELGAFQLGGHPMFLGPESSGFGEREAIEDITQVMERMCSMIIARVFDHRILEQFALYAKIPVVNALSDFSHPCQILSDLYTMKMKKKLFPNVKVAFIGDGNNTANSWVEASMIYPLNLVFAVPKGYEPNQNLLDQSRKKGISTIEISTDVNIATGADMIYTDTWTSMGQEKETESRNKIFKNYQVNNQLVNIAKPDVIVMHCLPAHHDYEITADVLKQYKDVIFLQAENRLHAQKALMVKLCEWST